MTKHAEPHSFQHDALDVGEIVRSLSEHRKLSQQRRYPNGVVPELPSRAAIKAIVEDLVATLYPRHFGPAEVLPDGVDGFIASALKSALANLREQIRRELQLLDRRDFVAQAQKAAEITHAFARTLPRTRAVLETDIRAAFEGDPAATSIDEVMFCYPGVTAIIRHRLAHRSIVSARRCWRASWRRSPTRKRESTSIPAPRSTKASSSTTAPAS